MKTTENKGFLTSPNAMGRSVAVKLPVVFQKANKINGFEHIFYGTALKTLLIVVLALGVTCGVVFAESWLYDARVIPPITLPEAYSRAMTALGSATNSYHCMNAQFLTSTPCGWSFRFYTTNGALRSVDVSTNKCVVYDGDR